MFFTENIALQIPIILFLLTIPFVAAQCNRQLQELLATLHHKINHEDINCCNMINDLTLFVSKAGFHVSAQGFFDVQPQMVKSVVTVY